MMAKTCNTANAAATATITLGHRLTVLLQRQLSESVELASVRVETDLQAG
jgi:hypothetical protein